MRTERSTTVTLEHITTSPVLSRPSREAWGCSFLRSLPFAACMRATEIAMSYILFVLRTSVKGFLKFLLPVKISANKKQRVCRTLGEVMIEVMTGHFAIARAWFTHTEYNQRTRVTDPTQPTKPTPTLTLTLTLTDVQPGPMRPRDTTNSAAPRSCTDTLQSRLVMTSHEWP